MKKTSDFRFWSRIGAGIFCLIAFAAFYIKAAIIKPEVSVSRFDTNGSGVPDLIRVYHDGKLQRELLDFEWTDVYSYRIYWKEDRGVKRIEKMLDVKKWFYEYYADAKDYDSQKKTYSQELDAPKTFASWTEDDLRRLPYKNVKLHIRKEHIYAAEYFTKADDKFPFLVAIYDQYGRFSEVYRDLDFDGMSDLKLIYEGGRLMARIKSEKIIPFDVYDYLYGANQ